MIARITGLVTLLVAGAAAQLGKSGPPGPLGSPVPALKLIDPQGNSIPADSLVKEGALTLLVFHNGSRGCSSLETEAATLRKGLSDLAASVIWIEAGP
jgi:hypothetical protein